MLRGKASRGKPRVTCSTQHIAKPKQHGINTETPDSRSPTPVLATNCGVAHPRQLQRESRRPESGP